MSQARRFLAAVMVVVAAFVAQPVQAAGGYYTNEGYYEYAAPGWWGGPDAAERVNVFEVDFNSRVGVDLFGCSGIGLFDFMKTTFNMNNITQQLKDSMKTILAKTLITTAMSVPQIASIFDTLNAFGNARFDIFKASCDMSEIRQDALAMYVERCKKEGMNEVECQEKYTSQSKNILSKVSEEVTAQLKESENANEAMRQIFCEDKDGKYNPSTESCGIMNFLPQFQVCIDSSVGGGCKGTYGKTNPALAWAGLANAAMMKVGGVMKQMDNVTTQLDAQMFPMSTRKDIADCAARKLEDGWKPSDSSSVAPIASSNSGRMVIAQFKPVTFAGETTDRERSDNTVKRYKQQIRNECREEDPLLGIKAIAACINERGMGTAITVDTSEKVNIAQFIKLGGDGIVGGGDMVREQLNIDAEGAAAIIDHGTNCAINKTGATDPYIWYLMQTKTPDERKAISQFFNAHSNYEFKMTFVDFLKSELQSAKSKLLSAEIPEPALKRVQKAIDDNLPSAGSKAEKKKALEAQREVFEKVLNDIKGEFDGIEENERARFNELRFTGEQRARMLRESGVDTYYIRNY